MATRILLLTISGMLATASPAFAVPTTVRASVDTAGGDADGASNSPSISGTARFVAFESLAADLVAGDGNAEGDVFVRDLVAGTTVRASVDTAGGDPDGFSFDASINGDGRFVAFTSSASDLIGGDANGMLDVFVRDLVAGTTVRASVDTAGGDPNGQSLTPSISSGGRFVAFASNASDLIAADGNGDYDVFVRDLVAGTTVRASVDTAGGDPNGGSFDPSISGNGRFVALESSASDLIAADGNGLSDVFVRDLVAGTTVRASVDTAGGDPNGQSLTPSLSSGGRFVAFESGASDLIAADGNGDYDIFVRDLVAGATVRASVDTAGRNANSYSSGASISSNGRLVAFWSFASDLVAGDGNGFADVFVRDLVARTTVRASVDTAGGDADSDSFRPSISAKGGFVGFESPASDLVAADGNGGYDIFVRSLV